MKPLGRDSGLVDLGALDDHSNNITLMRLLAAWAVLFSHSWSLTGSSGWAELSLLDQAFKSVMPYNLKAAGAGVSAFFFLSGFLIARSFERSRSISRFVTARVLRIYPALWVNLLFCVFIGAVFTSLSLQAYISDPLTQRFLTTNGLMWQVWFQLPPGGELFPQNPNTTGINGSLWTLPAEIRCYVLVTLFGVFGLLQRLRYVVVIAGLLLCWAAFAGETFFLVETKHYRLAIFFLIGLVAYHARDYIKLSPGWLIALLVISALSRDSSLYNLAAALTFSYVLLLVAFHPKLALPPIDRYGDYSYGLYLYAFPVQQSILALIPGVSPWSLFCLASLCTFPLAFLSWHLVEKRAMAWRTTIASWYQRAEAS